MKEKQMSLLSALFLKTLKRLIITGVLPALFFILTGCATVKFYSDPDLEKKTGLRYYTVKPYLLVEYQGGKENTVSTSVVYLPDLENPQYLSFRTWLGKNDVKLTFTNSALASYGVISESMVSETLEAIASTLSKSAYAAQGFTGPTPSSSDISGTSFRLYEIIPGPAGTTLKEIIPLNP